MSIAALQKQTNANIQAKANLIWEIATHLVGLFKPHEYGKVILPMTVLKRFDDALKPTKAAVIEMTKRLNAQRVEGVGWGAKFGPEGSSIIGSPSGNPE